MKISRFIAISSVSLILSSLSYQTPSYAQKTDNHQIIAQSSNQDKSPELETKGKQIIELFFAQKFDDKRR